MSTVSSAEPSPSHVIVPLTPGALCAVGLLLTDLRADFAQALDVG